MQALKNYHYLKVLLLYLVIHTL